LSLFNACILIMLLSCAVYAEETHSVEMRGFLYQATDGRLILAQEPNLKTCCIGAEHKSDQQIIVEGSLAPSPYKAVTLTGHLVGNRLTQAQRIDQDKQVPWGTLALVLIGCAGWLVLRQA